MFSLYNSTKKLILFFLLLTLFIFISNSLFANSLITSQFKFCKDLGYNESLFLKPENFQKINLKLYTNEKKFASIIIKSLLNIKHNGYVKDKADKIKAILLVEIVNQKPCYLEARIRPHGDLRDHYEYSSFEKFQLPSLRVELTNTHIFGIVEFILFRPTTRNGENEVYINSLFSNLGYLAPRTSFSKIGFKNFNYEMIFQEVINKEFLEYNQLVEGPILSGDERNVFENDLPGLSWHKLDNKKWIKQNKSNYQTSKKALDSINYIYFNHSIPKFNQTKIIDYHSSTQGTKFHDQYKKLASFDSLLFSTMSLHGISRDDRRFYYDVLNDKFISILYDSFNEQTEGTDSIFPNSSYFSNKGWILKSSLYNPSEILQNLRNLNITTFKKNLKKNGFEIKKSNIENRIKKTRNNLLYLTNNTNSNNILNPIFSSQQGFFKKKYYTEQLFNTNKYILSNNNGGEYEFEICDLTLRNCKGINLNKIQKERMLNQSLKIKSLNKFNENILIDLIYIGEKNSFYKINNMIKVENDIKFFQNKTILINNKTKLKLFGNIKVKIDKNKKQITFDKFDHNSIAVLTNGTLDNWKIDFNDFSKHYKKNNIEKIFGFNGCLNFYDIKLIDMKITLSNSQCEDAVNFVRASGDIRYIKSRNSASDAVDFDFSKLVIDQIEIINSGNDCIDFSYGDFKINYVYLTNCGDKAVSVGENSKLTVNYTTINKSHIGIASKDYSNYYGKNINIYDVNTCLSAYNKKPEFSGGLIKVNNFNCNKFKRLEFKDSASDIIFLNNNDI